MEEQTKLATFGAGCFWCVEAVSQRLEGVEKVISGYSGGVVDNPTYQEVCSEETRHAEACQITFDPARISYEQILEVFWKTTIRPPGSRQGNDVGTQYRSVIFYHDEEQRQAAQEYKARLEAAKVWDRPIVTEIVPFMKFGPEDYHQDYYRSNPTRATARWSSHPSSTSSKELRRTDQEE